MKKFLYIAVAMLLILSSVFVVNAETTQKGEVVYKENFENGETDIAPTSDKTGSVKIKKENGNQYLHFDGNKENDYTLACYGPYVADFDFTVKIRQKIHNGSWSHCMLLFHIDWNVNAYRVDFFEDHARLAFNNGVDDETVFGSIDGFGVSEEWRTVQIFGRGNEYTIAMDGELVGQFVSEERDEGNFGFCGWQTEFDVDDIEITEYVDGTAPAVETILGDIMPEEENNGILEIMRDTREMLDSEITALAHNNAKLFNVLLYVSIPLIVISLLSVLIVLLIPIIKKRKAKQ